MKADEQYIKNSSRNLVLVKKGNNRKKNFIKTQSLNRKYMLEGSCKQINNFVVQRNANSNNNFVTFQFVDHKRQLVDRRKQYNEKMKDISVNPSCLPNKSMIPFTLNVNHYNHKELYIQTMRPNKKWHLSNYKLESCELRRLQNQIGNKKNSLTTVNLNNKNNEDEYESFRLEVQGCNKNMMNYFTHNSINPRTSTSTDRRYNPNHVKIRMNTGIASTRMKSQHHNYNHNKQYLIPQLTPGQINQLIRRPTFKKGHFVFGLSDKSQPAQNKIQIFRDFLWKVNYSNRLIVINPVELPQLYKLYMGKGNNGLMVQGILKRRSWWVLTDKQEESNFAWTQLKINSIFKSQSYCSRKSQIKQVYSNYVFKGQKLQTIEDIKEVKKSSKDKLEEGCVNKTTLEFYKQNQAIDGLSAHKKIFNKFDLDNWRQLCKKTVKNEQKMVGNTFKKRFPFLNKKKLMKIDSPFTFKMHNHLQENYYIGNKKALFYNLRKYYEFNNENVFDYLPLTFHIIKGIDDVRFSQFIKKYEELDKIKNTNREFKNIWIMKPGQNTNRGNGITVCFGLDDIKYRLKMKEKNKDGGLRTFILQKYIEKPLLYKNRKFDIRHYMLITCIAGNIKAYWFELGYVRTSSSTYSLKNRKDLFVHLTNDAIQKNGQDYGKYESGNKISYDELEKYIAKKCKKDNNGDKQVSFYSDILPKMKKIGTDSVRATYSLLDRNRKYNNFELLGLDFMINQDFNPYLIQVNTNPCLQLSCPLLQSIIPVLIDHLFKLVVDPLFPPPENIIQSKKQFYNFQDPLVQNKFDLIFDELIDGQQLKELFEGRQKMDAQLGLIQEDDEQFDNDGAEWEQKKQ